MDGESNPQSDTPKPGSNPPLPVSAEEQAILREEKKEPSQCGANATVNLPPTKTRLIEWVPAAANVILAIVGIFAICIYGGQLDVMRGQLKEMRETTNLTRKQMEATSAADVELAQNGNVNVSFPVPPRGELRANLVNEGQVNAYNAHFSLSLAMEGKQKRQILSRKETVPQIRPTHVVPRPDFIYPFELTPNEYASVMSADSYLIAEVSFDYDNGFGRTIGPQNFCYGYVWGTPEFGRWTGACSDIQMKIREAKQTKENKPN